MANAVAVTDTGDMHGIEKAKLIVGLLVVAVAGSMLFSALYSSPHSTEAAPASVGPPPMPSAARERAAGTPAAGETPESRPAASSTAEVGRTWPEARGKDDPLPDGCSMLARQLDFAEGFAIDLDSDGVDERIAAGGTTRTLASLTEYYVATEDENCEWSIIGRLLHGELRTAENTGKRYGWVCHWEESADGLKATLVQIEAPAHPEGGVVEQRIQQMPYRGSALYGTPAVKTTGEALPVVEAGTGCDTPSSLAVAAVELDWCFGESWRVTLPEGWMTPPIGEHSCRYLTARPITLPCQCDFIPEISILVVPEAADSTTAEVGEPALISERRARTVDSTSYSETRGRDVHTRTVTINLAASQIVITATDAQSSLEWADLTSILDEVLESFEVSSEAPTIAMLYPEVPELNPHPLHLDAAGRFAWYGARAAAPRCDESSASDPIAVLDVSQSKADNLQFWTTGPSVAGQVEGIVVDEPDRGYFRSRCEKEDGQQKMTIYRFTFTEDGAIVSARETPLDTLPRQIEPFPATTDGRFRYGSGHSPFSRSVLCPAATGGFNEQLAYTILVYEDQAIRPALADSHSINRLHRVAINSNDAIVWQSSRCGETSFFLGRIDEEGVIQERRSLNAQVAPIYGYEPSQVWALTDDDELIVVDTSNRSYRAFHNYEVATTYLELPTMHRFDLGS